METSTASHRTYALVILYDMHTTYFINALAGIRPEDAVNRLQTKANHMAWLAGSLVQERFELAKLFGAELQSAAHELFKDHKGIQDEATYPSLASYEEDWKKISPVLRTYLLNASDEVLDKILEFPGMSFSMYEMVTFDIYREANCIGQLALWRRLLGYEAIKYM